MSDQDGEDGDHALTPLSARSRAEKSKKRAIRIKNDAPRGFHLNPEIFKGIPVLPGLDEIEVVLVRYASTWTRWTEGVAIHVVGAVVLAVSAFIAGLMFGTPPKAETAKQPPSYVITTKASAQK